MFLLAKNILGGNAPQVQGGRQPPLTSEQRDRS